jgi:hypothetical protein
MRAFTIALLFLIPISLYASARSNSGGLAERVAEVEAQVAAMEEVLQFVHVETEEIKSLKGPHWIIEGANVHVRSGSGNTVDNCITREPDFPNCETLTGLGNLIVGYNERLPPAGGIPRNIRTGSHNLVVGKFHSYSSFAGFVTGDSNHVTGAYASVSGGTDSVASGLFSSVSGGIFNRASGLGASVSGGEDRDAPDQSSWAAGSLLEPN